MNTDMQQSIAFNATTIDTIIKLCSTNNEMRANCTQDWFWIELYKKYNIPLMYNIKSDNSFSSYLYHFIHSYNAMLFAKYLAKKLHFNFTLNYIYNDSKHKVLSQLDLMDIDYELPYLEVNTLQGVIVLTKEDIEHYTHRVDVDYNDDLYDNSLEVKYGDGTIYGQNNDFDVKNIVSLTHNELIEFLYGLIKTDQLTYHYMYRFCPYAYDKHQWTYNLPLYILNQ